MKLSEQAKGKITRKAVLALALEFGFTELWINKLIEKNKENGILTTAKAVQIISEETGLSQDEILEESELSVKIAS